MRVRGYDGSKYYKPFPPIVRKEIVFDGTTIGDVSNETIFTVTGHIWVERLIAVVTEDLVSAGGGSLSVGCVGNTAGLIVASTATSLDAGNIWASNGDTPGLVVLGINSTLTSIAGQQEKAVSLDIVLAVTGFAVTDGTIEFYLEWTPLSNNARVVAA